MLEQMYFILNSEPPSQTQTWNNIICTYLDVSVLPLHTFYITLYKDPLIRQTTITHTVQLHSYHRMATRGLLGGWRREGGCCMFVTCQLLTSRKWAKRGNMRVLIILHWWCCYGSAEFACSKLMAFCIYFIIWKLHSYRSTGRCIGLK